jgi:hypothetical protein
MSMRSWLLSLSGIAVVSIAMSQSATAERLGVDGRFRMAQTSMGGAEPSAPPLATSPSAPPLQPPPPLIDNGGPPAPPLNTQPATGSWGAIAFTADGSYSTIWKMASKAEAEAKVAMKCASFGRGGCEIASISGQECVALATFIGNYKRRRWILSFTAGGLTYPDAQNAVMARCNSDERTQGRCQPRTAACADGR